MTTPAKFAELLREAIGFDVRTVGHSVIEHALRGRMAACGTARMEDYWYELRRNNGELQELIESTVVSETWFFRDQEAFAALPKIVLKEWWPGNSGNVLRLLSVPCSSGEEPYSMAMALLQAGLAPRNFKIDAVDISARALAEATRANYAKNSFRGSELDFRDRYFELTDGRYKLASAVREQVRFEQGNLLGDNFLANKPSYDVIFCRNVLIYFDAPAQDRALKVLGRLLAPRGVLFVGPSEAFVVRSHDFVSVDYPRAFAYRKFHPAILPSQSDQEKPRKKTRTTASRPVAKLPLPKPAADRQPIATAKPRDDLAVASGLADSGQLRQAAKVCETYLREQGASSEGYYLLGIVRDAMGDEARASDCYRKVIYLQPDHPGALLHLSLLVEKRGDASGARRLQSRVRRVEEAAAR